jgi:HlyD family secretion protein
MKKRLIVVGIFLAAGIAAALVYRFANHPEPGALVLSGNVEVTEVNVGFKLPGRVQTLFTDEGRSVKKGDKIAVLDGAEYVTQVAQNRAALQNVRAQLDKAKRDHDRAEMLYKQGVISQQQMEGARTTYDVALSQVQQASAALKNAYVKLNDTVIFAPLSGMVLKKNVEEGESVSSGTPIVTIGDLEKPWVKVYLKEDKLGFAKLGQKVEVTTDTYPDKKYSGSVTFISSEAEFTPKAVQTQEERVKLVFGVKVSVQNQNEELKPGLPADVKIFLK